MPSSSMHKCSGNFFSSPHGLLGSKPLHTSIKYNVKPGRKSISGEAPISVAPPTQWDDVEVPLLKLSVSPSDLESICLIISLFDHDVASADDPLGSVIVHLAPPAGSNSGEEYTIEVNEAVVYGNSTLRDSTSLGRVKCQLVVSHGAALATAKLRAEADRVGSKVGAKINFGKPGCCCMQ